MKIKFFIILIIAFSISCKSFGQKKTNNYDKNSDELNELGYLIDQAFPLVEKFLKKYGEFYPFSYVLENNKKIYRLGQYYENENPNSENIIIKIKKDLKIEVKNNNPKGIAIFYDVKTIDPITNKKTDAVAVFVEHKNGSGAYNFYYPYFLNNKQNLIFGKSFATTAIREIFK